MSSGINEVQQSMNINSKEYWDRRFETDWVSNKGLEQTRFFATVAAKAMPGWFKSRLLQRNASLCDWGCAEGQGVGELAKWLGTGNITGVDISTVAVQEARARFPSFTFKSGELSELDDYDVIFSSNTLEHFSDPFSIIRQLAAHAREFLVLLLPFQEYNRIDEHFFTFDYENIPVIPAPGFSCVLSKVIDTGAMAENYWSGKQIFLIYARHELAAQLGLPVSGLFIDDDSYGALRWATGAQRENELRSLLTANAELAARNASLQHNYEELKNNLVAVNANQQGLQATISSLETRLLAQEAEKSKACSDLKLLEEKVAAVHDSFVFRAFRAVARVLR